MTWDLVFHLYWFALCCWDAAVNLILHLAHFD